MHNRTYHTTMNWNSLTIIRVLCWKDDADNDHVILTYDCGSGRFLCRKFVNTIEEKS